jgi:hypothetical protein
MCAGCPLLDCDFHLRLVAQYAYGIPAGRAPVLHLSRADSGDMVNTYLEGFERVWIGAREAD